MAEISNHWHLKREVNISHLLTTAIIAVSLMTWASKVEQRLGILEVVNSQQIEAVSRRLDRMETKIDHLIQRNGHQQNGQ